jgi:hypothetical protein
MKFPKVTFSEIKTDLKTGDIFLFHGDSKIEEVIQIGDKTEWSHVGMIVLAEDIGLESDENVLFWESSSESYYDYDQKIEKSGPHLIKLQDLLSALHNLSDKRYFSVRSLETARTPEFFNQLRSLMSENEIHNATFPKYEDMIKNYIEGHFLNKEESDGTYFCSQLIAETYKRMGILTSIEPSNAYAPKSFSSQENLGYLKRSVLNRELVILYDQQ